MKTSDLESKFGNAELRRGVVTLAVLLKLRQENHGYGVRSSLESMGLPLKEGTIYPLLRRLEDQALLTSRWDAQGDRLRKYYLLTPTGLHVLGWMQLQWSQLNDVLAAVTDEAQCTTEEQP